MGRSCSFLLLAGILFFSSVAVSRAYEIKTQYATVVYDNQRLLKEFDDAISLGSLSYLLRNRKSITSTDEVRNKIDVIVERVEAVLDMFPADLKFTVVLLPRDSDVQRVYRAKYGVKVDYISFYAPKEKTIYVSVDDIRLGVFAHELTHVVLNRYFGVSPPTKIHEVLAQFVESHLED